MSPEQEPNRIVLSGIHVNLGERSVTMEADNQPIARVSLAAEGVVFEALHSDVVNTDLVLGNNTQPAAPLSELENDQPAAVEKEKTVVLSGRLKSKPKPGRTDARGNPTAWARFAAHDDERGGGRLLSTSFHRHTVRVALGLAVGDPLTVEGYLHEVGVPGKLDTFSVINLITYPGKV